MKAMVSVECRARSSLNVKFEFDCNKGGMQDTVDFTAFSKDCGVNWPEILQRPMKKLNTSFLVFMSSQKKNFADLLVSQQILYNTATVALNFFNL